MTRANTLRGTQVGTPVYFIPRLLTEVDWQVFSGCRPTDMPKELEPHIEPASLGTASFKSPARNGWTTCYAMPTLVPFLKTRSFSSSKAWWLTLRCLGSNMLRSSSAAGSRCGCGFPRNKACLWMCLWTAFLGVARMALPNCQTAVFKNGQIR